MERKEKGVNPFDGGGLEINFKEKVEKTATALRWSGCFVLMAAGVILNNYNVGLAGSAWFTTNVSWEGIRIGRWLGSKM